MFGDEGRLTSPSSEKLMVRFQSPRNVKSKWLGIRVQMPSAEQQGVFAKLRSVVEGWRKTHPGASSRLDESVISLRAAIRKQLNPVDLEFYYNNNRGKIRAAEMLMPTVGARKACGA